ncbi:hypothetical protein Tco_1058915 [Tanacetum coccineum]
MLLLQSPQNRRELLNVGENTLSLNRTSLMIEDLLFTSSMNDNIITSNSYFALNAKEEDEEEYVENVYDESANLFPNTKTSGSSSFTVAAVSIPRHYAVSENWIFVSTHGQHCIHTVQNDYRIYSDLTPEDKESNTEAHCNENKMVLDRFTQHTMDPLALMSNVSHQQYYPQSSTTLPSIYVPPHFADNTQLDSGLSPSDNLIENSTNILALLTQSYKTVDRIEDRGTMHGVQVQLVMREHRTELGMLIQVKQGRLSATTATENGVALDEEQLLFIACGQDNAIDEDVDEQPVQDFALNVDNVFQADDCDAFDFDVDEAPTAHTMFMANLSSADPVYDEVGPSYDSDILSEVHDHDHYQDSVCEHHEEHEMHDDIQPTYVVDSHADYTSDSNMIPYDQYVKDNAVSVVQSDVSSVPNDAYMMIFNNMHEQHAQSVSDTTRNTVVDNSLTTELATYKEQVELYERRARFELTEREQKIDE